MVYFCADDYGISKESNSRIEECLENGVLNKISVLPNGEFTDLKQLISRNNAKIALHINLVEGYPLSKSDEINMITTQEGNFKYSFIGLFLISLFGKKKELEKQLYKEIKMQIDFWKKNVGEQTPVLIDSHQHTHTIPLVFKTLMRVIKDEGLNVEYIRIPAEPLAPYILTPSLYTSYTLKGLIKQWLLKFLALVNRRQLKKSKLQFAYFMGAMFSGRVTEEKIKKLLPRYIKIAEKHSRDIEIALHPGYLENGEHLINGCRKDFEKFYFSKWRKKEYDTLMNFKF